MFGEFSAPVIYFFVWDFFLEWGWLEGSPLSWDCYGNKEKVDSAAEPILMVCALYVAFDGLTIIINGALKGCGRQMVQVGGGVVDDLR